MGKDKKTFLDEVAEQIIASQYPLDTIKIIVPSNRSIRFLNEAFKKVIDRPSFAPTIVNIETFIQELSGLYRITKIPLLFDFYKVYKDNTPDDSIDSFDQYLSWASGLLQEFNDIDAYLVSEKELFEFMIDLEKINQWGGETPLIKNYVSFNKRLPSYYKALYKQLLDNRKGYAGMQFREAVNNLAFYLEANSKHHYFIGFNALNRSEERIIQELISNGQATVFWDIDPYFFEDPFHMAGHFIRKYFKEWTSLKQQAKPKFTPHFDKPKKIEIISVAKNITQAKTAAQIVKDLTQDGDNSKTAVILGQESLLIPLISGIASYSDDWNVTMGYPLQQTTVASFFSLWFELHQFTNQGKFDFFRLESLLGSCSSSRLFKQYEGVLLKSLVQFRQQNQTLISPQTLTQIDADQGVGKLLFKPFSEVADFLQRLLIICDLGYDFFHSNQDQDSKLLASNFMRFKPIFRQLELLQEQYLFIKGLPELKVLLDSLLKMETIDFAGEPMEGIQVMGLLETRLLDFDNVIITNVNEGVLPAGKGTPSFIPYEVKIKFGMPTYLEQDTIFSYHFFRVLQRAKNIFLLYNATSEGLFSGEKSRFLYQLEYFRSEKHQILFKQVTTDFPEKLDTDKTDKTKKVEKTASVLAALKVVAKQGFSPSSLTQYIKNPYLFYERRVLGIKETKLLESNITHRDKGTILHNVLEIIYKPYLNKALTVEDYDQMLGVCPHVLLQQYKKVYPREEGRSGVNYIAFELTKELINNFLNTEKSLIAQGNRLKIIALEEKFSIPVNHPKLDFPIQLKGVVDRIDQWNDTIRIVDYKTGAVVKKDLYISELEALLTSTEKGTLFQVLVYAYVFKDRFLHYHRFQAGVISFRSFENSFLEFSFRQGLSKVTPVFLNMDHLTDFETQLFKLLSEIFDSELPFQEK